LVSASLEANHTNPKGKKIKIPQVILECFIKFKTLKDLLIQINLNKTVASLTSYDTIWATARNPPKREYLELDAQPEVKIGKTPAPLTQIKNINPSSKEKPPFIIGKTIHNTKTINKDITGIKTNKKTFLMRGTLASLINNFTASANGCKRPQKPTLLGPNRIWTPPKIFCSIKVTKATLINKRITKII